MEYKKTECHVICQKSFYPKKILQGIFGTLYTACEIISILSCMTRRGYETLNRGKSAK